MAKTMKQGICHTICVSFVLWMSAIGMYAQQVSEEAAEQFRARAAEAFPTCDVELQYGGQPIYYYILSAE